MVSSIIEDLFKKNYNVFNYFSIVDVVAVLTDSDNPQTYWRVLKNRLKKEGLKSKLILQIQYTLLTNWINEQEYKPEGQ